MLTEALLAVTGVISRKGSITEGTTVSDSEPAAVHQQRSVALSVVPVLVGGVKGEPPRYAGVLTQTVSGQPADVALPAARTADDVERAASAAARGALIEGIIAESEDESLMDRYLGGEEIPSGILIRDLETAVARGFFHPVIATSAETGVGLAEMLEVLARAFPPPTERERPAVSHLDGTPAATPDCDPAGPLLGEVVRTMIDPFLGRVCLVRLFSGTLREDTAVHVAGHGLADRGHADHDSDERVTHVYSPLGTSLRPVPYSVAGDICALTKLGPAETGDTVSARDLPLLIQPWEMPDPLLPVAVEPASHAAFGDAVDRECPHEGGVHLSRPVVEQFELLDRTRPDRSDEGVELPAHPEYSWNRSGTAAEGGLI